MEIAGSLPEDHFPELKGLLEAAVNQAPQLVLREIEIAQSEARLVQVNSQRLPGVGGRLEYAARETSVSNNTTTRDRNNGFFYNISFNQPVYHWNALKNQTEMSKIGVLIAEKNYTEGLRTLAVLLRRYYVELVARKSALRAAEFALGRIKADLASAEDRFKNRMASAAEVGGLLLTFDDQNLAVARSREEFTVLLRVFVRLSGVKELSPDSIPSAFPKTTYPSVAATELLARFLRENGGQSFQVQIAALRVEEADRNYRIQKVRLLPKFNLGGGYSLENSTNATQTSVVQTGVASQSVGINAEWRFFDGFATRGAKREALLSKRFYEHQVKTFSEAALDEAQALKRALDLESQAVALSERRRGLAEGQVKRAQEEIALGKLPPTALQAANNALYQSEAVDAAARATFLVRWSEFVSLVGEDPALNLIPVRYAREKR